MLGVRRLCFYFSLSTFNLQLSTQTRYNPARILTEG